MVAIGPPGRATGRLELKEAARGLPLFLAGDSVAQDGHVVGLEAFVCFHNVKAYQLTLAQNPAPAATNGTEVNEYFITTVAHDEAEAFLDGPKSEVP